MNRLKLRMAIASMMSMNLDHAGLMNLQSLNTEFMQRARGKGRGESNSVAMKARHTNPKYHKPHQGYQECARRKEQGY